MAAPEDERNAFKAEEFADSNYRLRDILRNGTCRKRILVTMFSQPKPGSSIDDRDNKHLTFCKHKNCYLDADVDMLYHIFKIQFNLRENDIHLYANRTVEQVHEIMKNVSSKKSNADYDIFVFGFFTYLNIKPNPNKCTEVQEWLEFADGVESLDAIMNDIEGSSALALKPKIFLVQADDLRLKYPTRATKCEDFKIVGVSVPTDADRLVLFSTVPQFFARLRPHPECAGSKCYENWLPPFMPERTNSGTEPACSLLAEAFTDVLTNPAFNQEHILSRTHILNGKFSQLVRELDRPRDYIGLHLPRPLIISTLTKKLYL